MKNKALPFGRAFTQLIKRKDSKIHLTTKKTQFPYVETQSKSLIRFFPIKECIDGIDLRLVIFIALNSIIAVEIFCRRNGIIQF